jgi:hypothetical protein
MSARRPAAFSAVVALVVIGCGPRSLAPGPAGYRAVRGWRDPVGEPDPEMPPTPVALVTSPEDARRM